MSVVRSLIIGLVCVTLLPAAAGAQRFGVSGGFSRQTGEVNHDWGTTIGMTAAWRPAQRVGARFDLTYHHVGVAGTVIYSNCFAPGPGCGPFPTRTGNSLNVVSATAAVVIEEHPRARGSFYWTAGVGAYAVTESPYDGAYARPGWNFGGGARVNDKIFFDVRYHQLIQPTTFRYIVPVTVGFHF